MTAATLAPGARHDLLNAARWIAKDNRHAARALRAAILVAARRIGENPEIGRLRPELSEKYRFWSLTGFPYVIVYDSARRPPLIVRILHGARHFPGVLTEA